MYIYLIYFLIIMFATSVGSLSGMGGGVIIKPSLDALSFSNLDNINFYSSLAVLTMSIVSIIKKARQGSKIGKEELVSLALGAIVGGRIGLKIFKYSLKYFNNDAMVNLIQLIITVILLLLTLYYTTKSKFSFEKKGYSMYFFTSMFIGMISVFLGIGGGPINVALFILIFGVDIKTATLYSIATIFFSQFTKNFIDFFITGISGYNLKPLIVIIPAAILGGNIGTRLNLKSSNEFVKKAYTVVTIFVILLYLSTALRIIFKIF